MEDPRTSGAFSDLADWLAAVGYGVPVIDRIREARDCRDLSVLKLDHKTRRWGEPPVGWTLGHVSLAPLGFWYALDAAGRLFHAAGVRNLEKQEIRQHSNDPQAYHRIVGPTLVAWFKTRLPEDGIGYVVTDGTFLSCEPALAARLNERVAPHLTDYAIWSDLSKPPPDDYYRKVKLS